MLVALGDALPAVLPAVPAVEPAVALVVPAVEPLVDVPDPLLMLAFVRMNDAPDVDPDGLPDAVDPAAVEPAVDPVVPVVLLIGPRCRQPTTVIEPACDPDRADDCWSVVLCAATSAAHATPIANVVATLFIYASLA